MPGIYERDNINYGGMLGNAMAAKANYLKNRYDRVADIGRTWGSAVSNSGQAFQNALNQYAQQQYNREQLAAQQQYQAEQNALNREDVLKRAREQQAWQAEQNALQRESTERIAGLNRQSALDERNAEKQAQAIMHYDIAKGALESIADEIMRTDDPAKLAQLYRQRDEQRAKMEYYAGNLPESYPGRQEPFKGYVGFTMGMGKGGNEAQPQTPTVPAGDIGDTRTQSVRLSDYVSAGDNAKTSDEVGKALTNMSTIDTSFLTKQEKEKLETDRNRLLAKQAQLLKSEEFKRKIDNWKPGDPVPEGYRINFVNRQPAGLKKK